MAKLPYMNDGEDYGEPDEPGSYFEEQCRKADRGDTYAQMEVDAMVEANNNALARELSMATAPVNNIYDDANSITVGGSSVGGSIGSGNVTVANSNIVSNGFIAAAPSNSANGFYNFPSSIQRMDEKPPLDLILSQENNLPDVVFNGHDFDSKKITMTLKPEPTISVFEALKITLLINASARTPTKFSVFAYIKKNNLERHFKFTQ